MCECRALFLSVSLRPVSYMRTEAPYPPGYSEPLCFSGLTLAQLWLRFGTLTGPKYCATRTRNWSESRKRSGTDSTQKEGRQ